MTKIERNLLNVINEQEKQIKSLKKKIRNLKENSSITISQEPNYVPTVYYGDYPGTTCTFTGDPSNVTYTYTNPCTSTICSAKAV